jgi:hypothetical protein
VKLNVRDLEALFNGSIWGLVQAGIFGPKVSRILDATDLETTQRYADCGQVTRTRTLTDKRGKVQEIEVTAYSWKADRADRRAHQDPPGGQSREDPGA